MNIGPSSASGTFNTFTFNTVVIATTGNIAINTDGSGGDNLVIAAPFSAIIGATQIFGGAGYESYNILPSAASTFTFNAGPAASPRSS